ncbi:MULTISPECIES: hypothetical protein [unclassified Nocardioides]|uniref:hypothetical protein n=1 Tax=unclassified Nocardioides TaxID=2615069 RepID=UPI0030143489
MTAAVLLVVATGCSSEVDRGAGIRNDLATHAAVAEVQVDDQGAHLEIGLTPGLAEAAVVALVAEVDRVTAEQGEPSYLLELRETDAPDVLAVDEAFAADARAAEVVAAWRRSAAAFVGETRVTYESGRTTVEVASGGGLAHDVTESSRLPLPPQPVTWRYTSGAGTVVLDGKVSDGDIDLVERVQRGVSSPSLPLAAASWRLERGRSQVRLDLGTDLGPVAPADVTPAAWGGRIAPLARSGVAALGRQRRPVVVRLSHPVGERADVFAWWTSDRPPADGRDRLARGWDAWLVAQSRAI